MATQYAINTTTLTAIADAIRAAKEVSDTYKPSDMAAQINEIGELSVPESSLVWSNNCQYKGCPTYGYGWFLEKFKNKITTDNITSAEGMFTSYTGTNIPIVLNFSSTQEVDISSMFASCRNLTSLPTINNNFTFAAINNMFSGCYNLREIPTGYFDNLTHSTTNFRSSTSIFNNCFSLRSAEEAIKLFKKFQISGKTYTSYSQIPTYQCFNCNYVLDEIIDFPIYNISGLGSQLYNYTFQETSRLARLTFETNEDGTAKTQNTTSAIIDLTRRVGYTNSSYNILNYNSGITKDKNVFINEDGDYYDYTDITGIQSKYQSLKNDNDWYSENNSVITYDGCNVSLAALFSRYNHNSAVETINSLPDTSNYGTATIKFQKYSGAYTDGGGINTLTDAEIAVATAKGWTVSLSNSY